MTAFNLTLTETLMLNETLLLARPYAFVTNSVRTVASMHLRLRRRPIRYVTFDLPAWFANLEPGDVIWATHDQLPEAPEGTGRYDVWRFIPLHVVEVYDPLSPPKITVKCIDLRDVYCSWWSPLRTDIGMTYDLNGIAIIDRAGGWETIREQVGYGIRPPGNDAYQEVLANNPIVDAFGLLTEGGGDTNHLLNSSFSEGTGNTFTSWTKTTTGAAVGNGWTLYTLIDANGFRRAIQLATYATGEQSYVSQTVNGLQGKSLALRVFYKDGGAVDRMRLQVTRSDTSEFLDASDGSWSAVPVDNPITPASGVIDTLRYVTPVFVTSTSGTVNITAQVGHFSAVFNAGQISQIQGIELLSAGTTTGGAYWSYRSPLPTKATAITRVRNITSVVNDSAVQVVSPVRGYVKMTIRPNWSFDDLYVNQTKYIWGAEFLGGGSYLRIAYFRLDATTAQCYLTNGDFRISLISPAAHLVRGVTNQIIARWTSTTQNEHDLPGQALDLWLDGVQSITETTCNQQATAAENNVYLGCVPTLLEEQSFDGYITDLTMDTRCPSYEEIVRI